MCFRCGALRDHTVIDTRGRVWIFEMHRFCGPLVLQRNGNPRARQPGSRSSFWPAFEAWQATQRKGSA